MKTDLTYIDAIYQREYECFTDKSYYSPKKVDMITYVNGIVLPFVPNRAGSPKGMGGVCNSEGIYVEESATKQENLMYGRYDLNLQDISYEDSTVVWGGYFIRQWGHFLVDVLPRLWWTIHSLTYKKIVFVVANPSVKIDGNYLELLQLLGIQKEQIEIVLKPTKYPCIVVPELSMQRPNYYTRDYCELLDYIRSKADTSMAKYSKVYFTRTAMRKAKNSEINEKLIENFFGKNGYTVLSPEKLSFQQQLSLYVHCQELVALCGTIPHNIVFARPDSNWIIINKTVRINVTQIILNDISKANVTYIDAYLQFLPVSPGTGPFWLDINDNILQFAKDHNMILTAKMQKAGKSIFERTLDLCRYCIMYFQLTDPMLDIGGEVLARSRPEMDVNFPNHNIYFFYRSRIGTIAKSLNPFVQIARNIKNHRKQTNK